MPVRVPGLGPARNEPFKTLEGFSSANAIACSTAYDLRKRWLPNVLRRAVHAEAPASPKAINPLIGSMAPPPPPPPDLEGATVGSKLDGTLLELGAEKARSVGLLLELPGITVRSPGWLAEGATGATCVP